MNPIEIAKALIATIIEDNSKATEAEIDSRIGSLIEELANQRAIRAQSIAQLKVEFFAENQQEFEQFAAEKISARAQLEALAREMLTALPGDGK